MRHTHTRSDSFSESALVDATEGKTRNNSFSGAVWGPALSKRKKKKFCLSTFSNNVPLEPVEKFSRSERNTSELAQYRKCVLKHVFLYIVCL